MSTILQAVVESFALIGAAEVTTEGKDSIVIVEQQYDEDYNFWGKLSTGEGWVCLSSIWEELEREGLVWECNQPE